MIYLGTDLENSYWSLLYSQFEDKTLCFHKLEWNKGDKKSIGSEITLKLKGE